jgi:hypothetical protein
VYHGVPREMVGEVFYPLTELQAIAPAIHARERQKYAGREAVLEFEIPGIGTPFNGTVHCASLHPNRLFEARREAGLDPPPRPAPPAWATGLAYEIPLERILAHPVVWYSWKTLWVNGAPGENVPLAPPPEEFEPFDPDRYRPLDRAPDAHLAYLRQMAARGARPLMFVHVPHVLVAGPIDVSGVRVVGWDEPPGYVPSGCPSD